MSGRQFLRRLLTLLGLAAPGLLLGFFTLFPAADGVLNIPLAHFYLVTFITFSAAVLSILLVSSLGSEAPARHILAAAGFAVIGVVFFSHGLATPGALTSHFHPAVTWSAWLTLLGGGGMFALAGLDGMRLVRPLPARRLAVLALLLALAYSAIAAYAPAWLTNAERLANPLLRLLIFAASLLLWGAAAILLGLTYRRSRRQTDGVLAFISVWLGFATISMHQYPIWRYSWWLYHIILLLAFLLGVWVLVREYERVRQFSLARYYLALSLVVTALLALGASALFTEFAQTLMTNELRQSSAVIAENLAASLADDLGGMATVEDVQNLAHDPQNQRLFATRLSGLPLLAAFVFDTGGKSVVANPAVFGGLDVDDPASFAAALAGRTQVVIRAPSPNAQGYAASAYDLITVYAPLRQGGEEGSVLGVLALLQEAPQLQETRLQARWLGLGTASASMGLLFVILLTVVGRADRILSQRTEELSQVSARLKTYSEWLLGKELLERLLANPDALSLIRRQRSVLFMDIRGFTHWSETHTPEEVVDLLNRYYVRVEGVMSSRQAIKFKFTADEAMGVFATPQAAAQAALELRQAAAEQLAGFQLGAGIGLHTGLLVEGLLGSMGVKFYDVIGDTVNTAKRIENAAGAGEILLSGEARSALGAGAVCGAAFTITAKGKEEPLTVFPLESLV